MLNINVHRNILLQILKDIYSDIELGPLLGFKGGTAAYLFYQLNRFSVDLDFDLLDAAKEETVFDKISAVLSTYGQIKDSQHKRYTIFFLMSYHHDAYNIKVEISRRHFGSSYETKNYLGIPMLVMLRPDMFAHKLVAMIEREGSAHRDIYDIWFFLKNSWPINSVIVEKRMQVLFVEAVQQCVTILEKLSDRHILSGIGELLTDEQKRWAKANLRQETIFLLKTQFLQL